MRIDRIAAVLGVFIAAMVAQGVFAQATISTGRGGARGASPTTRSTAADPGETATAPVARTGRAGATRTAPLLPPNADDGPNCTLDATIYMISLPVELITRIDIEELNKAAGTIDGFEQALAKIGKTKPLYRVSQSVVLGGDSILIGAQTPFVNNTTPARAGGEAPRTSISYSDVGAEFSLAGAAINKTGINLKMKIQLSVMNESSANITETVKAKIFRAATLLQNGQVEANKPFVVMSADAASADAQGNATAYIAKVILGEPKKF